MAETESKGQHHYQMIARELQASIEGGVLAVGARLPSTATLCRQYGVSTITIRGALKELVAAGLIESRPRSGFFVRDSHVGKGRNGLVALLVESGRSAFFVDCIAGVEKAISQAGYHLIVSNSYANQEFEAEHLKSLIDQVDGFIIMPVADAGNYGLYLSLLEHQVPFVFLDRYVEKLAVPSVTTDNELGGYLATAHLIECGCEQVHALFVKDSSSQRERWRGYERALREKGMTPQSDWVHRTLLANEGAGYELTRQLIEAKKLDQRMGLFCVNDPVARGAYLALKEAGLKIPGDVAVVGFDDIDAIFCDPPLTSVSQDVREMGMLAAQKLLELISGESSVTSIRLKPELMVRNSTDTQSEFSLKRHIINGKQASGSLASSPLAHLA